MATQSQTEPGNSLQPSGAGDSRVRVHLAHAPRSLTGEVRAVLKSSPMMRFTLRDVADRLGHGRLAEINAALHKLVFSRAEVVISKAHNGRRMVNTYQWRLPHHGR